MIRKEVSSREVLTAYDKAKMHALNYIRRKEFPNNPSIYEAICYWAAGLLSEKARFKDDKIRESSLLIEEARRILEPHVKRGDDFFTVSGDEFLFERYLRSESAPRPRRDRVPYDPDEAVDEPKEPLTHGHFHEHTRRPPKPPMKHLPGTFPDYGFPPKPPKAKKKPYKCKAPKPPCDDDINWYDVKYDNKYKIKVDPIYSYDGETAKIKAKVTNRNKPCRNGKLRFYVYEEE